MLVDVGKACIEFHGKTVHGLKAKKVQAYEIWSFVYSKQKNVKEISNTSIETAANVWTWVGIDSDTKFVISWFVGERSADSAYELMKDIKSRLKNQVQLTTEGLKAYLNAVPDAFGSKIDMPS